MLREVFGFEYAEIAASVDKNEAAVRQVLSRARNHVQARRPRTTDQVDREAVIERFLISELYLVRNPEKLAHLGGEAADLRR